MRGNAKYVQVSVQGVSGNWQMRACMQMWSVNDVSYSFMENLHILLWLLDAMDEWLKLIIMIKDQWNVFALSI